MFKHASVANHCLAFSNQNTTRRCSCHQKHADSEHAMTGSCWRIATLFILTTRKHLCFHRGGSHLLLSLLISSAGHGGALGRFTSGRRFVIEARRAPAWHGPRPETLGTAHAQGQKTEIPHIAGSTGSVKPPCKSPFMVMMLKERKEQHRPRPFTHTHRAQSPATRTQKCWTEISDMKE